MLSRKLLSAWKSILARGLGVGWGGGYKSAALTGNMTVRFFYFLMTTNSSNKPGRAAAAHKPHNFPERERGGGVGGYLGGVI